MNKFPITASVVSAAGLTLAATAVAAPSGPSSADQTVNQLTADVYTVIVNESGMPRFRVQRDRTLTDTGLR